MSGTVHKVTALQRRAERAGAEFEAAQSARRRINPTFLKADAELREAALAEAQADVVAAEQVLAKDLAIADASYAAALDETIEILRTYIAAREDLQTKQDALKTLMRHARAANLPSSVIPRPDSYEMRQAQDYSIRRDIRDRLAVIASKPW